MVVLLLLTFLKLYQACPVQNACAACRPGIALDHHLRPVIDNVESDLHVPGNSLNAVTRKHEHDRIMVDNQHILQRICRSKGAYSGMAARNCCMNNPLSLLMSVAVRQLHDYVLGAVLCCTCLLNLPITNAYASIAAQQWQQEGQQQKKYAAIRRRVMPEDSRPGTSQRTHRVNLHSSPEEIYRTSGRPATAASGLRLRSEWTPAGMLTEPSAPVSAHAAGRPMTAA